MVSHTAIHGYFSLLCNVSPGKNVEKIYFIFKCLYLAKLVSSQYSRNTITFSLCFSPELSNTSHGFNPQLKVSWKAKKILDVLYFPPQFYNELKKLLMLQFLLSPLAMYVLIQSYQQWPENSLKTVYPGTLCLHTHTPSTTPSLPPLYVSVGLCVGV